MQSLRRDEREFLQNSFPQDHVVEGLKALDVQLRSPSTKGTLRVCSSDLTVAAALVAHVRRVGALISRRVIDVDLRLVDSCSQDILLRLNEKPRLIDPIATARRIRDASRVAIILVLGSPSEGGWDEAVLGELESDAGQALLLRVDWENGEAPRLSPGASTLLVSGSSQDDLRVFWQGIVEESMGQLGSISGVQSFVASATLKNEKQDLSPVARDFYSFLRLLRRSCRLADLPAGSETLASELLRNGLVCIHDGIIVLSSELPPCSESPTKEQFHNAACLLSKRFDDSFAMARGAALHLQAGALTTAQECIARATGLMHDALVRREVLRIWLQSLRSLQSETSRDLALLAAGFCLDHDEIELALDFAQLSASGLKDLGHELSLIMGRVQLARGDLLAAQMSFERALRVAENDSQNSRAQALFAEVAYLRGDHHQAETRASAAIEKATESFVRLDGRNILGKLLLARSLWEQADAHFALDENDAACAGNHVARMRAKVNRAISQLSQGRAEQARAMLESVLVEASSEPKAFAFALSNLAVLAIDRHDYVQALDLSERAIEARRRLGDKVGLARVITNLAELRLRLGLVDEAEQALRFGRRVLSAGVLATRAAQLSLVEAGVHFARGNTTEADRSVRAAIVNAPGYTDGAFVGECHRLAARIALEDGDTALADRDLDSAEKSADSACARAEIQLLRTHWLRATGQDISEAAEHALQCAKDSRDDELLREATLLVSEAKRMQGDLPAARKYLSQAIAIRDKVAQSLPLAMRRNYLARRDFSILSNIENTLIGTELGTSSSLPKSLETQAKSTDTEPSLGIVGRHPSVLKLLAQIRKIAAIPSPVLVLGESGTGKELIADAVHRLSDRRNGPLIKVNCAALVESLLLSELFGHEKGAFTGAASRRAGRFEMAAGGTLFLDEIGDISPKTQVALLRVLQEKTFERVGGTACLRADVRIICATHRDLESMVADGTFREDLYYRLRAFVLEVNPLRARSSDLGLISEHLLSRIATERGETPKTLSPAALEILQRHSWPGNIRELENVLRAVSVFVESEEISADAILEHIRLSPANRTTQCTDAAPWSVVLTRTPMASSAEESAKVAYDAIRSGATSLSDLKHHIEQECIQRALAETGGNITRAATLLGMKRPRLSQLVKQYGMLENISEEC